MKKRFRIMSLALSLVLMLSLFSMMAFPASADSIDGQNIDDLEEFLAVADQYMGADIEETGITTCVTEEGRLQIMQMLPVPATRSGDVVEKQMVLTTLLVVDANGREAGYADYREKAGQLNGVYALHSTYYNLIDSGMGTFRVSVNRMTTTFTYNSYARVVSFYHYYVMEQAGHFPVESRTSQPTPYPSEGVPYSFSPSNVDSYPYGAECLGWLLSQAVINLGGTSFTVTNEFNLTTG